MEEKKLCPFCGKEILAVAKKCKHCGEWLDKEGTVSTQANPAHISEKKTGVKKWMIAIPLLLIAIIFGVIFALSNHHSKSDTEKVIAKADPVINFAEPEEDEDGSVYKKRDDGIRSLPIQKNIETPKVDNSTIDNYDSEELLSIGESYEKGIGVEVDYQTALKYYEKAAKTGDPTALNKLGNMYADGKGCTKNMYKAANYYQTAAEKGNKYAQHNLAFCYWDGNGVEKNREIAIMWMRRSAAQGFDKAQKALKIMGVD